MRKTRVTDGSEGEPGKWHSGVLSPVPGSKFFTAWRPETPGTQHCVSCEQTMSALL
jgi:hypothetical protein